MASELRSSSEQSKLAFDEISSSISNINDLTQNNASIAEEVSASTLELKKTSENLNDKIKFFKL